MNNSIDRVQGRWRTPGGALLCLIPKLIPAAIVLCGTLHAAAPNWAAPNWAAPNWAAPNWIIGGAAGQTVRIQVSAPAAGQSCSADVQFAIGTIDPPQPDRIFVQAGQVGFFDLNLSRLATRSGQRVEVRPIFRVTAGICKASVEVFEQFTGRTTAHLGLTEPTNPDADPPNPDLPALGVGMGQVVRLGVVRGIDPPQPDRTAPIPACNAVLSFTDAQGRPLGASKIVSLQPGEMAFLDFPNTGGRATVQPNVTVPSTGGDASGCGASVQVYEPMTGWTVGAVR